MRRQRPILNVLETLMVLTLAAVSGAQAGRIPPDVLMVNDLNCVIHQQGKRYHATCTASYLNHDGYHHDPWVVELPEQKTEKASYNDTVKWRREVLKVQATAKPVNAKDLKQ